MRSFALERAEDTEDAVRRFHDAERRGVAGGSPQVAYLSGGTTVVDLMKLDVLQPDRLIDLGPLKPAMGAIELTEAGLYLGAMATMSEVAANTDVQRHFPVIVDSLRLAASGQLRNVATVAGNLLQRTRCSYFRDRHAACNKREPGSGCSAVDGVTRSLAVLGVSEHCMANYPGDFAVALVALDATLSILGRDGVSRRLPVENLHRLPRDTPHIETTLKPGELITSIFVPSGPWTSASLYLKVRDRASYAFALASAAVALDLDQDARVRSARIALGGLATKPWRCRDSEEFLAGKRLDVYAARAAADLALAGAQTDVYTRFKPLLGRRTLIKALLDASSKALTGSEMKTPKDD